MEEAVVGLLTVDRCAGVLAWSSGSRLERVARASREVALREFDEFARTAQTFSVECEVRVWDQRDYAAAAHAEAAVGGKCSRGMGGRCGGRGGG